MTEPLEMRIEIGDGRHTKVVWMPVGEGIIEPFPLDNWWLVPEAKRQKIVEVWKREGFEVHDA